MRDHPQFAAYTALISVCFFWGTTYLGIRMALEALPTFGLMTLRFCISGCLMLGLCRLRGLAFPGRREFFRTALFGIMILGVGNSCLTYSETMIPSSLAALFIAASPFWMIGIEAIVPGGDRLRWPAVTGMLIGFCGAALLVAPDLLERGVSGPVLRGFLLLQLGCSSWSLGSILQKRTTKRAHPFVSAAIQQLATGVACIVPAMVEQGHPPEWSGRGIAAIAWLIVFGSIVGYSSYIYALEHLPVALVSIHTYVNPVVAVVLGWWFYREAFGAKETAAMAIIFVGVWVVKRFTPSPALSLRAPLRSSPGP